MPLVVEVVEDCEMVVVIVFTLFTCELSIFKHSTSFALLCSLGLERIVKAES